MRNWPITQCKCKSVSVSAHLHKCEYHQPNVLTLNKYVSKTDNTIILLSREVAGSNIVVFSECMTSTCRSKQPKQPLPFVSPPWNFVTWPAFAVWPVSVLRQTVAVWLVLRCFST